MITVLTVYRNRILCAYLTHTHARTRHDTHHVFQAFAMTSFFFVLVSITGFCLETLPEMTTMEEVTRRCDADDSPAETVLIEEPHFVLKYIDYICTAFFSVEFLVRVVFAPNKLLFFRSVMNMIDIAALLPLYLQVKTSISNNISRKHAVAVFYHIRDLRRIRRFITLSVAKTIATALVSSKLDYCNSIPQTRT